MISLMGFKARVFEVYFQNETLVVRLTKLYDFTQSNSAAFKTCTQWYMGKLIDDTFFSVVVFLNLSVFWLLGMGMGMENRK